MAAVARSGPRVTRRGRAAAKVERAQPQPPGPGRAPTVAVETLRSRWSAAFFSAEAALRSARPYLPPRELAARSKELTAELAATDLLLEAYARGERPGAPYLHLTLVSGEARRLLGLPPAVDACVFNLDGVLLGSASLHLAAWTETFDEFLTRRSERTGGRFAPFNPRTDYTVHLHGKPRLEGVRAFLATRGIRLPDGRRDDDPGAETVYGLANRKNEALRRRLDRQGVTAFEGSHRYLETARDAEVRCAVVSASANTDTILERSGLAGLIDAKVDGNTIVAESLAARPAPDILTAACELLDAEPARAAVFETTPAGVAAARAAGFRLVVAVDRAGESTKALRSEHPDLVVSGLSEVLDGRRAA
jgi:beta-phosphoglucomutase-like phosphatase (HAD superfamily)